MAQDFSYQLDEFYFDLKDGGSRFSLLTAEEIVRRPFPGLRPYKTSEFQLFKGRGGHAEELMNRLKSTNFLAVIGSSGTGKSSLVRAGLIPQLLGGYLYAAGNEWDIAVCRPGKDPVENLAVALACVKCKSIDKNEILKANEEIRPKLNESIYGLLEAKELLKGDKETAGNLMIIVDQFEELFRFDRKDLGRDAVEKHFVNLLLKAVSVPASSIYVIITMRSEFLGDSVKYRGLPEAINGAQYLVPQLNRDQLKEVIEGPIKLAGKKIASGLVELLVNEIEESKLKDNLDQLPIMQHALMRTYNEAMRSGGDTEITYAHYEAVGGMEKALANHAKSKYMELGDGVAEQSTKQGVAKIIFQSITDLSSDAKGGRRPTDLGNIYEVAAGLMITTDAVDEVINNFRDYDTSFIMPPLSTELQPNIVIDISHESLMRNWEQLNDWIVEEVNAGKLYKILNDRRDLFERGKDGYLRGGLLDEITQWESKFHDSAAWAKRYNTKGQVLTAEENTGKFIKNITFLENSRNEQKKEAEKAKEQLKEAVVRASKDKRTRRAIRSFIAFAAVVSVLLIFAINSAHDAKEQKDIAQQQLMRANQQAEIASEQKKQAEIISDSLAARTERLTRDKILLATRILAIENSKKK